jgi:tungstate transport system permease protein
MNESSGIGMILNAFWEGVLLIFSFDPELWFTIWVSIEVALGGVIIAAIFGIPIGYALASWKFPGRGAAVLITNTLVGVPTVLVGLFFFMLFSRTIGILSPLNLLYERPGMIIALGALGAPLAATLTNNALRGVAPSIGKTAQTLGAGQMRTALSVLSEARYGIIGALIVTFGRLVSELGIATMIGGNIRGKTRTMSTAIALETGKGELEYAFALGIVLLIIVLAANVAMSLLRKKE